MRVFVFLVCLAALWAVGTEFSHATERNAATSQSKKVGARTDADVHRVLDKHKGAIYAAYIRALRENPNLKGKLLLSIAIAPDGQVTKCSIAFSSMNSPEFEKTIIEHFSAIDFEVKGTEVYTNPKFPLAFFAG